MNPYRDSTQAAQATSTSKLRGGDFFWTLLLAALPVILRSVPFERSASNAVAWTIVAWAGIISIVYAIGSFIVFADQLVRREPELETLSRARRRFWRACAMLAFSWAALGVVALVFPT